MMTRSPRSWRLALVAGAIALTAASCSATGGDDAADVPTTAAPSGSTTSPDGSETTTTEGDDPVPTTDAPSEPREVTIADLEAILPTAQEVGGTFAVDDDSDEDSETDLEADAAMEASCPGISEFLGDEDEDEERAEASFQDADNHVFEVALNPNPNPSFEPETLDDLIDTINGCDTITYTDADGWDFTIDLRVERTDDIGDTAIEATMNVALEHEDLPAPIELGYYIRSFVVGTVTVTVSTSDGIDDRTYEAIPRDDALVDEFADEMETRVTDLLAG